MVQLYRTLVQPRRAREFVVWSLLWCAVLGCSSAQVKPSLPSPLLGQPLPRLGRSLDGQSLDVASLRGKVVLVEFFAEYCEPCERLLPEVQALHVEHPDVVVLGVSLDEQQSTVTTLIAKHRLTFPVVHDRSRVIAGRFRVRELPVTFLVDRRGSIHWVAGPDHTPLDVRRAVASVL